MSRRISRDHAAWGPGVQVADAAALRAGLRTYHKDASRSIVIALRPA